MSTAGKQLKDVVSRDVVFVNAQDTLREALDVMVENRVSAMPVVDARGHCVGVISVTDLLGMTKELADELNALSTSGGLDHAALVDKLEHADVLTEQVQASMSRDVMSVDVAATVEDAAGIMLAQHVHRLIVTEGEGRMVGVVSTMDLLAALVGAKR